MAIALGADPALAVTGRCGRQSPAQNRFDAIPLRSPSPRRGILRWFARVYDEGDSMPILGAHMSIAGGYYRAVELAHECGCDCVQLFTKNNNQWRAKELTDEDAEQFQAALARLGIGHPIAHDSYLINLASPDDELWEKSVEAFRVELLRAEKLGIPLRRHPSRRVHRPAPSSRVSTGSSRRSTRSTAARPASRPARCWKTRPAREAAWAGGSSTWRRSSPAWPSPSGWACASTPATCSPPAIRWQRREEYEATIAELDRVVGLERVKAIHLNDSKQPLGSRVDRHEHIGRGTAGARTVSPSAQRSAVPPDAHVSGDRQRAGRRRRDGRRQSAHAARAGRKPAAADARRPAA